MRWLVWLACALMGTAHGEEFTAHYREVHNGLIFRNTPQVVEGPDQDDNILPHLETLRRVDYVQQVGGWVQVQLRYVNPKQALGEPITAWISHENYARYVEPQFPNGVTRSTNDLKQKPPPDPNGMRTHTVSLSDSTAIANIPARDETGRMIPYWAPDSDDSSPMRLIYTVPDMKERWVPRELVQRYSHVSRSKVDFMDADGKIAFRKNDYLVEIGFDKQHARVYRLNDPNRVVYEVPVQQLRSPQYTNALKVDVSELENDTLAGQLAEAKGLIAKVPAGKSQEFTNSKMKKISYRGPLKMVKVGDGDGKFSWASRVDVIEEKTGKSLGRFYMSEKYFEELRVRDGSETEVADEDEGLRDVTPEPESAEPAEEGAHLGNLLGKYPAGAGKRYKVSYVYNATYCGERAGKFGKYYYEEPKLDKRSGNYGADFVAAANATDMAPGLLATMVHIESKFNPSLENMKEKNSVGGNEHHKANPSIWGKGIAQLGRAEGKVLNINWFGAYSAKAPAGSVWNTRTAITKMGELLLKKVKEVNHIEEQHNALVAKGLRKKKIEPPGTLIKFMLDRASFQDPPVLKADGSNKAEVDQFYQTAQAERARYLISMYNRGMRAPKSILAYLERTGSFPGYYGQAWAEAPHATQSKGDVLSQQQINRGHIYRSAGLCGGFPAKSALAKYSQDFSFNKGSGDWSRK